MAAAENSVTFSVTVTLRLENDRKCVKRNEIRKFRDTDSWCDIFDVVTEDIADDIPPKIEEQFEKRARVTVSSSPGTDNTYSASPYDQVKVLTDFDKNLKYVTIDIDCEGLEIASPVVSTETKRNAFQVLMGRPTTRAAPKFSVDKPRFSGDGLQGVVFVRLQLCCQSPVELPYYSATCTVTREDVCCYCASTEDTRRDEASLRSHRVVLPMCKTCTEAGKEVIRRLPKKN